MKLKAGENNLLLAAATARKLKRALLTNVLVNILMDVEANLQKKVKLFPMALHVLFFDRKVI